MAFGDATSVAAITLGTRTAQSVATLTEVDGTEGNKFVANRNTILRVKNASGEEVTVTVNVNHTVFGLAVSNATFAVPATTGDVVWTGFETIFHHSAAKEAWITFSSGTSVTMAVYQPL